METFPLLSKIEHPLFSKQSLSSRSFLILLIVCNVTVLGLAQKNWVGGVGDWNMASNWDPVGIPLGTDDVIIDAGDEATIPTGYNATAKSIYLSDGGKLTVSNTGGLDVDNSSEDGISVYNGSTIDNYGTINIGNTSINRIGLRLWSNSNLNNYSTGIIEIKNAVNNNALNIEDGGSEFVNDGQLLIGNLNSVLAYSCISITDDGKLTNNSAGVIELNNSVGDGILADENSIVNNYGTIAIGDTEIGENGIKLWSGSQMNNYSTGILTIGNCTKNYALMIGGGVSVFTNNGHIDIGGAIEEIFTCISIWHEGGLTNNGDGVIELNNSQGNGIYLNSTSAASLINYGHIKMGNTQTIGYSGINASSCSVINEVDGVMEIDNVLGGEAISLTGSASVFENKGAIRIGSLGSIKNNGIRLFAGSVISNTEDGLIEINNVSTKNGIEMYSSGNTFTNSGTLKIGTSGSINNIGLLINGGEFVNTANALLEVSNTVNNNGISVDQVGSSFTNSGTVKIGNSGNAIPSTCLSLFSGGTFSNIMGSTLELNNANGYGLYLNSHSNNLLSNAGAIRIGNISPISLGGLLQDGGNISNGSNGSIEVNNITNNDGILIKNVGSNFVNSGSVYIGNSSGVNRVGLFMTGGNFTNETNASLEVNNILAGNGIETQNTGTTIINKGSIKIGNTNSIKNLGMLVYGGSDFYNSISGTIEISNTLNDNGLSLSQFGSSFTNCGTLLIGTTSGAIYATCLSLFSGGNFSNEVTGQIELNNAAFGYGVYVNANSANSFTNMGQLKIGNQSMIGAGIRQDGGAFFNMVNGSLEINNISILDGINIKNAGTSFDNAGTIEIGNLFNIKRSGLRIDGGTFSNTTNGQLNIDRIPTLSSGEYAFNILSAGIFSNLGTTRIGTLTPVKNGISGGGSFFNTGTLVIGDIVNDGVLTGQTLSNNNMGTIDILASGNLKISGTLENADGATINLQNGSMLVNDGTLENDGLIKGIGTFEQNNILTNNSTSAVAPGASPGTLNVSGDFDFGSGTYNCEINGITPSTEHDVLSISGDVVLINANLVVDWGSFTPVAGQSFEILLFGSRTGDFSSVTIPPISGINFNVNYLSNSVFIEAQSALPVELLSFYARPTDHTIHLTWQTATETNNQGFIIEKSPDGKSWQQIGYAAGQGTTLVQQTYQYIDDRPFQGMNYYRLKQVDFDGKHEYSKIVSADFVKEGNAFWQIHPNPSYDQLCIFNQDDTQLDIQVYDMAGKKVIDIKMEEGRSCSDVAHLPTGTYLVKSFGHSQPHQQLFIKN